MTSTAKTSRIALTAAVLLAAAALSAGCKKKAPAPPPTPIGTVPGGAAAVTPPLPKYWFESDFDEWIGKRWSEIDLFQFLPQAPSGMDEGTRYVVFYGRTCDHCEEMFKQDLAPDATLAAQVTAVDVPTADAPTWEMPDTGCELLTLPSEVDWIITTPLTVRVENGIVQCATEADHRECMGLEAP